MTWYTPPKKVIDEYVESIQLFLRDDKAFQTFKRHPQYTTILEGNEQIVYDIAYESLTNHGGASFLKQYYERFKENDSVGNPVLFGDISPATMRYINTAFEIKSLLDDFLPRRILEIGGGYGGLCKTLSVIYDFDEYTDKDLPEAEELFLKYTSHFPSIKDKVNTEVTGKYDVFIADSSLAECHPDTQLAYGKLAIECEYVYIVYNTLHVPGMSTAYKNLLDMFRGFEINSYTTAQGIVILFMKKNGSH